jgi:hypothetical protein
MHMTIPQMIKKFKYETGQLEESCPDGVKIPGGSFNKNLKHLFTILDADEGIYAINTWLSNNAEELLRRMNNHNTANFGKPARNFVKAYYLHRAAFNVSAFFAISLEVFCQSGGFDLLKLVLQGPKSSSSGNASADYTPSFQVFTQVLTLVSSLKDLLEFDFYAELVADLRDLCLDYAQNRIDEEALRIVTRRELSLFIQNIESLLSSVVLARNKNGEERLYQDDVYSYTEKMELEFALKCLRMPILEKKFIGHAILGQKITQVKAAPTHAQQDQAAQASQTNDKYRNTYQGQNHISTLYQLRQRWLTKEILIEWMDKNQIFNMMFGESLHPEVIKNSYFLLEFLYHNDRVGEE